MTTTATTGPATKTGGGATPDTPAPTTPNPVKRRQAVMLAAPTATAAVSGSYATLGPLGGTITTVTAATLGGGAYLVRRRRAARNAAAATDTGKAAARNARKLARTEHRATSRAARLRARLANRLPARLGNLVRGGAPNRSTLGRRGSMLDRLGSGKTRTTGGGRLGSMLSRSRTTGTTPGTRRPATSTGTGTGTGSRARNGTRGHGGILAGLRGTRRPATGAPGTRRPGSHAPGTSNQKGRKARTPGGGKNGGKGSRSTTPGTRNTGGKNGGRSTTPGSSRNNTGPRGKHDGTGTGGKKRPRTSTTECDKTPRGTTGKRPRKFGRTPAWGQGKPTINDTPRNKETKEQKRIRKTINKFEKLERKQKRKQEKKNKDYDPTQDPAHPDYIPPEEPPEPTHPPPRPRPRPKPGTPDGTPDDTGSKPEPIPNTPDTTGETPDPRSRGGDRTPSGGGTMSGDYRHSVVPTQADGIDSAVEARRLLETMGVEMKEGAENVSRTHEALGERVRWNSDATGAMEDFNHGMRVMADAHDDVVSTVNRSHERDFARIESGTEADKAWDVERNQPHL